MAEVRVALLRGVNVGKAKRVAMADLRALAERLGGRHARTLLNSGNLVFADDSGDTGRWTNELQRGIRDELGVDCAVTVISAGALGAMLVANPLQARMADPSRHLVAVLREPEAAATRQALADLQATDWAPDAFATGPGCAYLDCASGILDSRLAAQFERRLRDAATSRNWATLLKLQALCDEVGAA